MSNTKYNAKNILKIKKDLDCEEFAKLKLSCRKGELCAPAIKFLWMTIVPAENFKSDLYALIFKDGTESDLIYSDSDIEAHKNWRRVGNKLYSKASVTLTFVGGTTETLYFDTADEAEKFINSLNI